MSTLASVPATAALATVPTSAATSTLATRHASTNPTFAPIPASAAKSTLATIPAPTATPALAASCGEAATTLLHWLPPIDESATLVLDWLPTVEDPAARILDWLLSNGGTPSAACVFHWLSVVGGAATPGIASSSMLLIPLWTCPSIFVNDAKNGPLPDITITTMVLLIKLFLWVPADATMAFLREFGILDSFAIRARTKHRIFGGVALGHLPHSPGIKLCDFSGPNVPTPELGLTAPQHLTIVPFVTFVLILAAIYPGTDPLGHREMDSSQTRTIAKSLDDTLHRLHILLGLDQSTTLLLGDAQSCLQSALDLDRPLVLRLVLCQ